MEAKRTGVAASFSAPKMSSVPISAPCCRRRRLWKIILTPFPVFSLALLRLRITGLGACGHDRAVARDPWGKGAGYHRGGRIKMAYDRLSGSRWDIRTLVPHSLSASVLLSLSTIAQIRDIGDSGISAKPISTRVKLRRPLTSVPSVLVMRIMRFRIPYVARNIAPSIATQRTGMPQVIRVTAYSVASLLLDPISWGSGTRTRIMYISPNAARNVGTAVVAAASTRRTTGAIGFIAARLQSVPARKRNGDGFAHLRAWDVWRGCLRGRPGGRRVGGRDRRLQIRVSQVGEPKGRERWMAVAMACSSAGFWGVLRRSSQSWGVGIGQGEDGGWLGWAG